MEAIVAYKNHASSTIAGFDLSHAISHTSAKATYLLLIPGQLPEGNLDVKVSAHLS